MLIKTIHQRNLNCQRNGKMYSEKTFLFARSLVDYYSKFNNYSKYYTISLDDISDFDLHELAQHIMSDDESLALEATSQDNPAYETTMLPALLKFMSNTTDMVLEKEFTIAWRNGVSSYFHDQIKEILDELCADRTHLEFNNAGLYPVQIPENGEIYWSRA